MTGLLGHLELAIPDREVRSTLGTTCSLSIIPAICGVNQFETQMLESIIVIEGGCQVPSIPKMVSFRVVGGTESGCSHALWQSRHGTRPGCMNGER